MDTQENENALVDLTSLKDLLGGSVEGLTEILNLFITHTPPSIEEMKELLDKQKWEELKKKIHGIKAYYGYVGNDPLNARLEAWEHALAVAPATFNHQEAMQELTFKTNLIVEKLKEILKKGV